MATKRLIDANALMEHLTRCIEQSKGLMRSVCVAIKCFVEQMPTVDAVEVVRCKDCIHWYETEGVCLKIYSDGAVSPYAWQDRNPDDFCSYGERKDNGATQV